MNRTNTATGNAGAVDFPWSQVQQLDYQDANTGSIVQACHAMLYARTDAKFVSQLPCRAWVLMQMRFDGKLGFPGGIVSDHAVLDATLEDGLNRELKEELGLDMARFAFNKKHYIVSHYCPKANLILNFYAQEVTEHEYKEIEATALGQMSTGMSVWVLLGYRYTHWRMGIMDYRPFSRISLPALP